MSGTGLVEAKMGPTVARIEFDFRTDAPPEAVRAALLDFSERRPALWPGLIPAIYEVYEGVFGKLFIGLMALTRGVAIRRSLQAGLARIAATGA